MEFLIISGLSGAGKTMVVRQVEDMGYYAVDNMPADLFPAFAELCAGAREPAGRYSRVVLTTDIRAGQDFSSLFAALKRLEQMGYEYKIIFIEKKTEAILRRYKETRRRHPLARDSESLEQALRREQELLAPLREKADYIIDTTTLSPPALRSHICRLLTGGAQNPMIVSIFSFGYKYGIPSEADMVLDVRFLPNPFNETELRPLSGLDEPVRDYVWKCPQSKEFIRKLEDMIGFLLPLYIDEGRASLVIAVGCTGGRHRSVTIARALQEFLLDREYTAVLSHRDIGRDMQSIKEEG